MIRGCNLIRGRDFGHFSKTADVQAGKFSMKLEKIRELPVANLVGLLWSFH